MLLSTGEKVSDSIGPDVSEKLKELTDPWANIGTVIVIERNSDVAIHSHMLEPTEVRFLEQQFIGEGGDPRIFLGRLAVRVYRKGALKSVHVRPEGLVAAKEAVSRPGLTPMEALEEMYREEARRNLSSGNDW